MVLRINLFIIFIRIIFVNCFVGTKILEYSATIRENDRVLACQGLWMLPRIFFRFWKHLGLPNVPYRSHDLSMNDSDRFWPSSSRNYREKWTVRNVGRLRKAHGTFTLQKRKNVCNLQLAQRMVQNQIWKI